MAVKNGERLVLYILQYVVLCLQCFDTNVGWPAQGTSGLYKDLNVYMLVMVISG